MKQHKIITSSLAMALLIVGCTIHGMEKSNKGGLSDKATGLQEPSEEFLDRLFAEQPEIRSGITEKLDQLWQLMFHQGGMSEIFQKMHETERDIESLQYKNQCLEEVLLRRFLAEKSGIGSGIVSELNRTKCDEEQLHKILRKMCAIEGYAKRLQDKNEDLKEKALLTLPKWVLSSEALMGPNSNL